MSIRTGILLVLFSLPVQAQGWYLGGGGGSGEVEVIGHDRLPELQEALQAQGYDIDGGSAGEADDTSVWNLLLGYQFDQYWALEGSFIDLGDTSGHFSATLAAPSGDILAGKLQSEYRAASAALLASYPLLEMFYVQARLGAHYWEHELSVSGSGQAISIHQNIDDSGTGLLYGFGTGVMIGSHWDARLEWQRFDGIEDEEGVDTKTVTLIYRF